MVPKRESKNKSNPNPGDICPAGFRLTHGSVRSRGFLFENDKVVYNVQYSL